MNVKAKKHLGQHFLTDQNIAGKIVDALEPVSTTLEVGPGTGVLTKFLLERDTKLLLAEIDGESISYLKQHFGLNDDVFVGDFLKFNFSEIEGEVSVLGNFPYNISSQILFHIIENYTHVPQMVGMFQKEVAERTAALPRTKAYGILSVLVQAYYEVEYLFTVHENVFNPPPKVKSGVISLRRSPREGLAGNKVLFKKIVKAGFNQRRKKLSNALKVLDIPAALSAHSFMDQRAEELSVSDFILLAHLWQQELPST